MQSTFKYISSLTLCILVVYSAQAQKIKAVPDTIKMPLYNGIFVQADIASIASSLLSKGETYSYEAAFQADLKHKFFPTIELGFAGANKLTNDKIGFKTNGLFGRIGIDFNVLTPKKDSKPTTNLFLVGLRLGMTNYSYNISNITITDDYWGGTKAVLYNDNSTTKIWYEIAVGVRVEVLKNIFMGWTLRSKSLISNDVEGNISPWYIPGFGINNGTNWTINYTIGYKFNIPSKSKSLNKLRESSIIFKK